MWINKEEIYITGNPEAPIILAFETDKDSVSLYWKFADNGGSEVNLIIIEYRKNSSETWKKEEIKDIVTEYTISSLSERVTYDFRMAVSNSIGMSEYTSIVTLVTTNKSKKSLYFEIFCILNIYQVCVCYF